MCFAELARQRLVAGASIEALDLIGEVRGLLGNNYLLDCLEARALAALRRWPAALEIFERLSAIDADTLVGEFAYDRNIFGAGALAEAGLSLFRAKRYADSAAWYRRAMGLAPERLDLRAKWQLAMARAR
jgi:tetratricopeptide (TPR) repeat protein